jgi:hypothetical protein
MCRRRDESAGVDRGERDGSRNMPVGLAAGRLGGAGLDAGADTTQSLGIVCIFSLLDAAGTDRRGMRQCPTVRQEIEKIRRIESKIGRMILLGVGQLAQHILQVILDHQMMSMGTADHAEHLHAAWGRVRVAEELPVASADNQRPNRSFRLVVVCALQRHVESSGANPDRRCSSQPEALGAVQEVTNGLKHSKIRLRRESADRAGCNAQ